MALLLLLPLLPLVQTSMHTRPPHPIYTLPDSERRPGQTLHELEFEDDEPFWDVELVTDFDVEHALLIGDARGHGGQVKTVFGAVNPTKTWGSVERTVPSYEREDPRMVGLGLEEEWVEGGGGRGWGGGLGAKNF